MAPSATAQVAGVGVVEDWGSEQPASAPEGRPESIEERQLAFEERKFNAEARLRERDLAIRDKEARFWPRLVLTFPTALLGGLGMLATYWITSTASKISAESNRVSTQNAAGVAARSAMSVETYRGQNAVELAQRNFEAQLILQSIGGRDTDQAIKSLKFIINAGLIPDFKDIVLKLATENKGAAIPVFPVTPYQPPSLTATPYPGGEVMRQHDISKKIENDREGQEYAQQQAAIKEQAEGVKRMVARQAADAKKPSKP